MKILSTGLMGLLLALAIAACGGDDDDGATATPTPAPNGQTPADVSPVATQDPGATDPPDPTATPDQLTATPVQTLTGVIPEDVGTFLSQFAGDILTGVLCDYDESQRLVDCSIAGYPRVQLTEPVNGSEVRCVASAMAGEIRYVTCESQSPRFSVIYQVLD